MCCVYLSIHSCLEKKSEIKHDRKGKTKDREGEKNWEEKESHGRVDWWGEGGGHDCVSSVWNWVKRGDNLYKGRTPCQLEMLLILSI